MIEISVLIAIVGCFVGLAGWLTGRDKKIAGDAEWRGSVNAKLDTIHNDIGGVSAEIKSLRSMATEHEGRLCAVESSTKSAHHRIDRLEGVKKNGAE